MNPLKQLAGQTAIYGLGTIVPRLLNFLLLTPFYTRVFFQGEYGMVTELVEPSNVKAFINIGFFGGIHSLVTN